MTCFSAIVSLLVCVTPILSPAGETFIKERKADELYGRGVHAYNARDYATAKRCLDEVERLGSTDPRPYFFLALTLRKLDQKAEADAMFKRAARMEWESRNARDYSVPDALRRVQGDDRVHLETFRTAAREQASAAAEKDHAIRFGNQPSPNDIAARSAFLTADTTGEGFKATLQTAVKYSPVLLRPERPFVGRAAFGARSIDPFRPGFDDTPNAVIDTPPKGATRGPAALTP